MTVNSPRTDTPYPVPSDIPDGPAQLSALVLQLEKYAVGKASSTIDRDTRIISPAEGDLCYRTDIHRFQAFQAPSWKDILPLTGPASPTWTPQIDQGASTNITKTVSEARHVLLGAVCFWWFDMILTGSGTGNNNITVTLPVAASGHSANEHVGSGLIYDSSTGVRYHGNWELTTTSKVILSGSAGVTGIIGSTLTASPATTAIALASGDVLRGFGAYLWA